MSDIPDLGLDIDRLKLRQIIADIDQKLADRDRKRQEIRLAPWSILFTVAAAITGAFAAGAAFYRLLQP